MSILLITLPIVTIFIFGMLWWVLSSDSKSYMKNMDTSTQLELEKKRKEVQEEIAKKIANAAQNKLQNTQKTTRSSKKMPVKQNPDIPVVNRYEKYLKQRQIENIGRKEYPTEKSLSSNNKTLVFSKENIIRGLITKEYLNRPNRQVR